VAPAAAGYALTVSYSGSAAIAISLYGTNAPLVLFFSKHPQGGADRISLQVLMAQEKKSRWKVPLSLMATGVAGAAVLVLRGCWHRKMSWPVRYQQHSYQVCLGCGIKRLFDEKSFCAYGPYSYDLNKLISWDLDQQAKEAGDESVRQRPA
jgi:hypothetical protein